MFKVCDSKVIHYRFVYGYTQMSKEVSLIFITVIVSWVLFIFNFVLGYYVGRAVESAETKKDKLEKHV